LSVLASLSSKSAVVPILWFYEVGNGLVMAYRRKRITFDQIDGFLTRLKALPIDAAQRVPTEVLELPAIAEKHGLTNYDAAYLALAMRLRLSLATTDRSLAGGCHSGRHDGAWIAKSAASLLTKRDQTFYFWRCDRWGKNDAA
ncbi:MAG: type II toxin-antitoxin system VapC family toxin, partial [Terriglobales bacterium]